MLFLRALHGSNNWEKSNLREWLNSENATVKYSHQPPDNEHIYGGKLGYATEAGFLNNFTKVERNAIQVYSHKSILSTYDSSVKDGGTEVFKLGFYITDVIQNYDAAYYKNVNDKVFLLDVKEIHDYIYNRGWQYKRIPTDKAAVSLGANYQTGNYVGNWLSTPYASRGNEVRTVEPYGDIEFLADAGIALGVCPAINLKTNIVAYGGDGSINSPYAIIGNETINFTDVNLETAIREKINKPTGDILLSDAENITELNLTNKMIKNIEGLQYFTNLNLLDLQSNSISNIEALSPLTNLVNLDLSYNLLNDISPLSELINIEWLYLNNNHIDYISALTKMTNLTALYIHGNPIYQIDSLNGLSKLALLGAENCSLNSANLSTLVLPDLIELNLQNNAIQDIAFLRNFPKLAWLQLDSNNIGSIQGISGLTNIKYLSITWNNIGDITALSTLTGLTHLELTETNIEDISPLSGLTSLKELWLTNNNISDISALSELTNLDHLYIYNAKIKDISPLSKLVNLVQLSLERNYISDISSLPVLEYTYLGLDQNYLNLSSDSADMAKIQQIVNLGCWVQYTTQKELYALSVIRLNNNTASVDVTNHDDTAMQCKLIISNYDVNKRLVGTEIKSVDLTQEQTNTYESVVSLQEGGYIKAFIWNDLTNSQPLSNVEKYYVEKSDMPLLNGVTNRQSIIDGEYIYRSTGNGHYLYRWNIDGSNMTLISSDTWCSCINIVGDYIYYTAGGYYKLYKIKKDGTGKTLLDSDWCLDVKVVNDWIYYSDYSKNCYLYKIKTDGSNKTRLNYNYSLETTISGDWLYYVNYSDGKKIYKISLDGTNEQKVTEDMVGGEQFCVADNWIYFMNENDNNKIYKVMIDGSNKEKVSDSPSIWINLLNEWIYYSNGNDGYRLYKMKKDGTENTKLSESTHVLFINVSGNKVYFQGDYGSLVSVDLIVNTDGTNEILGYEQQ